MARLPNPRKRHQPITLDWMTSNVDVSTTGCWIWLGSINKVSGYGYVNVDRIPKPTHRVMLELADGPIEDGMQVDHLCRNRQCCNPAHLESVTPHENSLRGNRSTSMAREGACAKCGRSELMFRKSQKSHGGVQRACRPCAYASRQKSAAKKKAASNG